MSVDLAEVRRRAQVMDSAYTALKRATEAAVVRWAWATPGSALQRLQPLYAERHGIGEPDWLDGPPDADSGADEYGYDAEGRIIVAREYGGGEAHSEEFLLYAGDSVLGYRYHRPGVPAGCTLTYVLDGQVVHHVDAHAGGGFSVERYAWEQGRVVRIEHQSEYRMDGGARTYGSTVHAVEYDDRGAVAAIVEL